MRRVVRIVTILLFAGGAGDAAGQTLRGSTIAMQRQNEVAKKQDFTFLQTSAQVRRFVAAGYLVPVRGNGDYRLAGVSHPYARPAVRTFVERLAAQYHAACGERLIVTSLTRPVSEQPRNASDLSVHPAGMAVDLRVSNRARCRSWLEKTLLELERRGVVDATRERNPAHYHVAVFPNAYTDYVRRLNGGRPARLASANPAPRPAATEALEATLAEVVDRSAEASLEESEVTLVSADVAAELAEEGAAVRQYRVNRGDTLWTIARRHGTTVEELKELNGLRGSRIAAGQTIAVPAASAE